MSGKLFEYFFEPEDLEPFYSELVAHTSYEPKLHARKKPPTVETAPKTAVPAFPPSKPEIATEPPASSAGEKPNEERSSVADPPSADKSVDWDQNLTQVRQLFSVHALGQFVFCARSAILAAESGDQQDLSLIHI